MGNKIYHNLPASNTRTVIACPKPSFNDWDKYIHNEVSKFEHNEIFEPVEKQNQHEQEDRIKEYAD